MSQTAGKTYAKVGDVETYGLRQYPVNKDVDSEIPIGGICDRKTDLTPEYFDTANAGAVRPIIVARGNYIKPGSGYQVGDQGATYVAGKIGVSTMSGVFSGKVCVMIDGLVHPGRKGMTAGNNKIKEWDTNSDQTDCCVILGAPGQNTGEWVATNVTNGLAWVEWYGGNS